MCGIVGIIDYSKGGFFQKDVNVFKELLIVNSLRGSHSTGMFGGKIQGEMDFAKAVGNPFDFIQNKEVEPIFSKMTQKHKLVVGHGRHATRGSVIGEFAHPFQKDHITMVHNGTVSTSKLIDTMKHVSDSKAICEALAQNDAEEVFADINGAYAIAYHDANKHTFSLVRNKERPLTIALDTLNSRVYFSSEKNILEVVAYRNGISFKEFRFIPEETIFTFKADTFDFTEKKIYKKPVLVSVPATYPSQNTQQTDNNVRTIRVTSTSTGGQVKVGDRYTVSIVEAVESKSRKGEESFFQAFGRIASFPEIETSFLVKGQEELLYGSPYWEGTVVSISEATSVMKAKGQQWYVYMKDAAPSDNLLLSDGTYMTRKEYKEKTESGCSCCAQKIDESDCEEVLIVDNEVFCSDCTISFFNSYTQAGGKK